MAHAIISYDMVVTVTGANDLMRKSELDALVKRFVSEYGDMAVERYDGEETGAERMHESLQSLPFLSERKLVVLDEPGKQKAFAESIDGILDGLADSTDAVIIEPKLDKRSVYYKTLKKRTDYREFEELDPDALSSWLVAYAGEKGGKLARAEANLLIDRLGPNQLLLKNELDKLLSFDPAVTGETIRSLTEPLPQGSIFALLDAAFAGKPEQALALYREQRAMKVEPQAIVAMLAWQLHAMLVVKTAGRRTVDEIARQAKLNPFVIRKNQAAVRRLSRADIERFVSDLLALDIRQKSSPIDADEALELYILKLAV